METDSARIIDEWIIGRLTLIADNTASMWRRLTGAAHQAVTEGMGTGYGTDEYDSMWRHGTRRREWAEVVGLYVADEIREMIEDQMPDDVWRTILLDLLTLTDHGTRMALGEHYLPDPDDIEWTDAEGVDDDGEI